MPVEVEVHTVPRFKAPVYGKVDLWWLKYGSNFSIQTSLLKIGCLLHKSGHFYFQLLTIVKLSDLISELKECTTKDDIETILLKFWKFIKLDNVLMNKVNYTNNTTFKQNFDREILLRLVIQLLLLK